MIKSGSKMISEQVLSNGAYKFVALIASIILWLTVLGRKEVVITHELTVNFLTQEFLKVEYDSNIKVKLKIYGQRKLLKEYKDQIKSITYNLKDRGPGVYTLPLTIRDLNLPLGLRLMALQPETIELKIKRGERNE